MKLREEVTTLLNSYILPNNSDIYRDIIIKNEDKFKSDMKKWKKDKKPKKEEPFKKDSKYGLLALFLQDWERRIVEAVLLRLNRIWY